jgi:cytochrome P450
MDANQTKSLPPGSTGLPLIGETLSFLKSPYGFVEDRVAKYGPIFRTNLLGTPTAVVVGAQAATAFIDGNLVQRQGSQPDNVYKLFAGPSLPHLDELPHRDRKAMVRAAFSPEALRSYLPALQARVERSLAAWSARKEVRLLDELQRLALESVAESIMGISDAATIDKLSADYALTGTAFTSLPIPIPGSAYSRGLQAVDRILVFFEGVIREHRAQPRDDGLSRILAFKTQDGRSIDDDQAKRELHHLIIAGRVVYAHLVGMLLQLTKDEVVRQRLREEIERQAPWGPLTLEQLAGLSYLSEVLMEVKRITPVIPGMFAKSKQDIEVLGYRVPKGWMVMFGLHQSHVLTDVYPEPERFDPERFSPEHAKRPEWSFCPHGPGKPATSHHCAGTDYATLLAQTFTVVLLRSYGWELPEQDLEFDWSRLTPEPRDGLRGRVYEQPGAAT